MKFAELIEPLPQAQFFQQYWEEKPMVIHRADRNRYAHLLSTLDIEQMIAAGKLRYPDITIAHGNRLMDGKELTRPDGTADPLVIREMFHNGGTIILFQLQRFRRSLAELCGTLEQDLSIPFQANIYFTPPYSPGVRRHFDEHDVFLLQTAGSKDWTLYESAGSEAIMQKFTLEPGDIAYIPRGIIHETATRHQASLHITLGALPLTAHSPLTARVNRPAPSP